MKFAHALLVAGIAMSLPSAKTFASVASESAALTKAGMSVIDGTFFHRGTIAALVGGDGSLTLLFPFKRMSPSELTSITVIQIGDFYGSESLQILHTSQGRESAEGYSSNGSGGGVSKQIAESLHAALGQPLSQQLTNIGFKPYGTSKKLWSRVVDKVATIIVLENEKIQAIYKPAPAKVAEKINGASVVGYTEVKEPYGSESMSGLVFRTNIAEMTVLAADNSQIQSVKLIKDLKDVQLSDLGFSLPAPAQDSQGFKVGGLNTTRAILMLTSILGLPVSQIESNANKVAGCSSGDPLLANGEDLLQTLAADNEHVEIMGLTHQTLARPLLLAQAVVDGDFGTKFILNGTNYEVSRLMMPMCGSLKSPFADGYSTSIMFPRITNLTTGKTLDFSYLHPYLINQYGFYGSRQNRSRVSPDSIAEVFQLPIAPPAPLRQGSGVKNQPL